MANGNRLAQLLGLGQQLQLTPSPQRSQMVQLLQQQQQRNQARPSFSALESASIAAPSLMAGLLSRREQTAQQQQSQAQRQALLRAMGIPEESANVGLMDPRTGQTPNREVARMLNPRQEQMSALVRALSPEQTEAAVGGLISQTVNPQQQRPAAVTDIGKINQDVLAGNITKETGQFLTRAARSEDARTRGKAETELRKELMDVTSGFAGGLSSLNNARRLLALEDNPVAAQSALTAYVRAIDNSVVRPSEQQMYQNIFGLAQSIENRLNQLGGAGAFTEESKQEILEAVDALAASSEEYLKSNISFYRGLAEQSKLKPENVTGSVEALIQNSAPRSENRATSSERASTEEEPVLRIN